MMYNTTKETILTVLLTAIIVAGGMYAYFNFTNTPLETPTDTSAGKVTNDDLTDLTDVSSLTRTGQEENETALSQDVPIEEIDEATKEDQKEEKFTTYKGKNYSFSYPEAWTTEDKGRTISPHWDTRLFYKDSHEVARLQCPIPETGFPTFKIIKKTETTLEGRSITMNLMEDRYDSTTGLGMILMQNKDDWRSSCVLIAGKERLPNLFDLFERIFETVEITTNPGIETVFEPKTFTNEGYGYSIDHPKNWHRSHYGKLNDIALDVAGFDPNPLLGPPVEYLGLVSVNILDKRTTEVSAELQKNLQNIKIDPFPMKNGMKATYLSGELPPDGLNMGASNKLIFVFFQRNQKAWVLQAVGPTPDQEKIFNQMVESFKFTN
ncbi:hypothetical protein HOG48_06600 [Candidatus Peregrinibacteria bacterium]|jgi:hypothetical protein|nr:hypothetical protein [Candidatus Peregrinibacteria bacterium]